MALLEYDALVIKCMDWFNSDELVFSRPIKADVVFYKTTVFALIALEFQRGMEDPVLL